MSTNSPGVPPPERPSQDHAALTELAMDLRWTWNHCADELWSKLDPDLWHRRPTPTKHFWGTS